MMQDMSKNLRLDKKYKSRKGENVEILMFNGPDKQHPVVVAYQDKYNPNSWRYDSVTATGSEFVNLEGSNDLIEDNPVVTVRRVIEMTGTQEWIDKLLERSIVTPTADFVTSGGTITEVERTVIK